MGFLFAFHSNYMAVSLAVSEILASNNAVTLNFWLWIF